MEAKNVILTGCEVLCLSGDLVECPLPIKEQRVCMRRLQYEAGMLKVVVWFYEQTDFEDDEPCPYYVMNKKVWQAKLKEWGITLQDNED